MYSDGNEEDCYVAYNVNDEGVNGRNGDQFYVPNDDSGVILSLNTLVFGGNGSLPSGPRYEAPEAVQQQIQPSFQSVWRDWFLYPMYMDHRHHHYHHHKIFQDEGKGVQQEARV
jgi:hypothetical protein